MRSLISWAENHPARARRIMLFSVTFSYILITIALMILVAMGKDMSGFLNYYWSYSTVAGVCIGFYTGTKPSAVEDLLKKVNSKDSEDK